MTPADLDGLTTLAARLDRGPAPPASRANDAYLTRLVELAASSRLQTVLRSIAQVAG